MENDVYEDNSLVLAAEDFSLSEFNNYHHFTRHDRMCISKLQAHGPVLLKGARGSGKSALMIEASLKLYPHDENSNVFGIYLSLRHLGLLRSTGVQYEKFLCSLIVNTINKSLPHDYIDEDIDNVSSLQISLTELATRIQKRIVILFDDAAHIGRETSLNEFFDIFRTLSSSVISCKASIYPGVTRFGTRFDVYNDATVIDISRGESSSDFSEIFLEVMNKRFSDSLSDSLFQAPLTREIVARFLGKSVLANMRAFMFSCNQLITSLNNGQKVTLSHISETLKNLATNYYWPLIEEIQPKLGIYEPMVDTSVKIAEILFEKAGEKSERTIIILREINSRLSKPLEILEYTGFVSRREVSRVMKSRGRGSRYALNLCNILERMGSGRLTIDLLNKWDSSHDESIEFHKGSELFTLELPEPNEQLDLGILSKGIDILRKSNIYPYGLTAYQLDLLKENGCQTVEDVVSSSDECLLAMRGIGVETIKRIRSTVNQAIWM